MSAAPTYAHLSFLVETKRALRLWKYELKPGLLKEGESICASVLIDYRLH